MEQGHPALIRAYTGPAAPYARNISPTVPAESPAIPRPVLRKGSVGLFDWQSLLLANLSGGVADFLRAYGGFIPVYAYEHLGHDRLYIADYFFAADDVPSWRVLWNLSALIQHKGGWHLPPAFNNSVTISFAVLPSRLLI